MALQLEGQIVTPELQGWIDKQRKADKDLSALMGTIGEDGMVSQGGLKARTYKDLVSKKKKADAQIESILGGLQANSSTSVGSLSQTRSSALSPVSSEMSVLTSLV